MWHIAMKIFSWMWFILIPPPLMMVLRATSAAIFSGCASHVMDVFGMKTDKQFVNALEDIIRECGAPTRLLSPLYWRMVQ
jgi:hypothetical protein